MSGLPIRNEDQHSAEIATMSLHLLSAVKNFTVRHRPGEKLKLRIGIHSGKIFLLHRTLMKRTVLRTRFTQILKVRLAATPFCS